MLNSMLPALIASWALTAFLFRVFAKVERWWWRWPLRLIFAVFAFVGGLAVSLAVFTLSLWVLSGVGFHEFLESPTNGSLAAWMRMAPGGALAGAVVSQMRKWPNRLRVPSTQSLA